jgi:copper chaperone CopZ
MSIFSSKKQTVKIEGMMCDHCAHHVQSEIEKINGVKDCYVSLKDGTATVKSKDGVDNQKLKDAVTAAGYKVVDIQ